MAVDPGLPETVAEFEEFGRRRFSSGLDNKQGQNVLVISGSVVGGGGGGTVDVSGQTVIALVSGQPVGISGQTVIAKVSGETIIAKVSGETVVARISGETVYLAASGMGPITARSGSLDPNANPLHVLVISGSVAGTGGGDPTTIRSGLISNLLSGSVDARISGQPVGVSGQTVVTSISGNVVVLQSGAPITISGQNVATSISGQPIVLAVSGPRYPSAGSGLDPSTYPLHVMVVSGSILGSSQPVSVSSGLAVLISGQAVTTFISGQPVGISGQTVVVSVSGNVVEGMFSGYGRFRNMLGISGVNTLSGNVPGILAVGFVSGYNTVVLSGQTVIALVSGQTVIAGVSGQTVVVSVSGNVVVVQSGAPITISGQFVATYVSGQPVGISGQTVIAQVSGQPVGISGQTVVAQVSGQTLVVSVSGNVVVLQSGAPLLISGQTVVTSVSGQPVVLAVSGPRYPSAGSGLDPSTYPLHVMVVSGSLLGSTSVSVSSGLAVLVSGQAVSTLVSGQPVGISGQTVVVSVSGNVVVLQSGAPINISGQFVATYVSGQPVGISGQTVVVASGLAVLVSGQAVSTLVSGQPVGVSGQTVVVSVSGNVVDLMFSGYGRWREMLGVSGVNTLSGNVPGVQAVGFVSGYNRVVISGQTVIAKVSGEAVRASSQTDTAGDNQTNNPQTWLSDVGGTSVTMFDYLFALGGGGLNDRIRNLEAFGVLSGLSLAVGMVSGFDRVRVSGETVVAQVSGQFTPTSVSGQPVVFAVSGPQYPSAGSGLDPSTYPLHVMVVSGSLLGSTSVSVSSGLAVLISGQAVSTLVSGQPVGVSGQTVIAQVSGQTVVVSVSGNAVVLQSGAPITISGQTVATSVSGQPVVLAVSGPRYPSAGSGLDPSTYPLHVLVVSGSLIPPAASVTVESGLAVLISGQAVTTLVSGQPMVLAVSGPRYPSAGSGLDPSTYPLHVIDVSGGIRTVNIGNEDLNSIAALIDGSIDTVQTGTDGLLTTTRVLGFSDAGGAWQRLRTTVGLISGLGRVGILAVGIASGWSTVKVSGETLYLAASGMGPITSKSGSLEPTFNPLHVLVISGSVAGTGGGDPTTIRSGLISNLLSGSVDARISGQPVGISGQTVVASVSGNVVDLMFSGYGRWREMLGVSGVNTVSGNVPGVQAVGFVSGYNRVVISGQTIIARVSGEAVRLGNFQNTTSDNYADNATFLGNEGATSEQMVLTRPQLLGGGGAWDRIRNVEAFGAASGLPLAVGFASGWSDRVRAMISGEAVRISGETVVTSVSGNVHYLATSGMPMITSRSGSLDTQKFPLHVLVVSGSVTDIGIAQNIASGTVALWASGMGLLTAKSGRLDPGTNPLHVLVVSGSTVHFGPSGYANTVTISGQQVVVANRTPFAGVLDIVLDGQFPPNQAEVYGIPMIGATDASPQRGAWIRTDRSGYIVLSSGSRGMALYGSGFGLLTVGGSLDPARLPLHVLVVSGSIPPNTVNVQISGVSFASGTAFASLSGLATVARVGRYTPISQSGGVYTSGDEGIWSTSGKFSSGAYLLASGEDAPMRVDQEGRQIVRVDRVHTIGSGLGTARIYAGFAFATVPGGMTLIAAPSSGNYLRVKSLSDSLLSSGVLAHVAYRFGSGGTDFFYHKHMWGVSGLGQKYDVTDEWQMPPGSIQIQGPPNPGPGALIMRYVAVLGTDRSGVAFTALVEEVGSGDIY